MRFVVAYSLLFILVAVLSYVVYRGVYFSRERVLSREYRANIRRRANVSSGKR